MLDSEDEEQGNGLVSEIRLVCVESSGKICRSSVTVVDSRTHGNKIYYYYYHYHNICHICMQTHIINTRLYKLSCF